MYDEEFFKKIFPFWDKLSDNDKNMFERYSSAVSYDRGTMIHSTKAECTGAIIVKTGCIRAYMMSDEGREITLYRLYPGDICMLSASCVLKSITFDVFIDAVEKSECLVINGKTLSDISQRNMFVKNFALETAVSRFSDVMWVMQQILFMSLDKRLAIFLCSESEKNQSDTVRLTHEQIAKYMGSAREAVSRMLKYLSRENIVESSRAGVRITDRARLEKLAFDQLKD
ncbi:MAG: Crp/Fnr family transcriptional regulator [Oscillospiraceae bacterium]|nr:Crp/Fnr family transcriptional regulator [Oscillospiraceae bacterium]